MHSDSTSKVCPHCGSSFHKPRHPEVIYCSRKCSNTVAWQGKPRTRLEDRFWQSVDKSGDCWIWTGSRHSCGYGQIATKAQKPITTHRLSYIIHNGPIPSGMVIRHTCDNPPCVRPDHLVLGTHADNVADKVAKKRHRWGSRMPTAKLTESDIPIIRRMLASGVEHQEIASRFGVSRTAITYINIGKTWRHVVS